MPGLNEAAMGAMAPIRDVVIPVAGQGTRMLPFTKAIPKEMLPVGSKPLIQYAIEEAVASGVANIILVTRPNDRILHDYFQREPALEHFLEQRGRHLDAQRLRCLSGSAEIHYVCQNRPLGLGHAIGCARELVGDRPFGVILPDALILGPVPCLAQLIEARKRCPGSYIATRTVPVQELNRFGILNIASNSPSAASLPLRVSGLVEKPNAVTAPSRFGVFGRYLFEPGIFRHIERVLPDPCGEIQISPALDSYCSEAPVYALPFVGDHFDVGNPIGLVQACVRNALEDPALAEDLRRFLEDATFAQHSEGASIPALCRIHGSIGSLSEG